MPSAKSKQVLHKAVTVSCGMNKKKKYAQTPTECTSGGESGQESVLRSLSWLGGGETLTLNCDKNFKIIPKKIIIRHITLKLVEEENEENSKRRQ